MEQSKGKILIVEDEEKIVEVLTSFLQSRGFAVISRKDGLQALKVLAEEDISLVILDLMLPGMSGEEICVELRKRFRVPVIMLTAKVAESDLVEGLKVGADDYVTKPLSLKELMARIEAVLRRAKDRTAALFEKSRFNGGDLEIDLSMRSIRKKGNEVKLTPIEYSILEAMMRHPRKVFTRDELIEMAFTPDFDGYDRVVDTHIKNIRQKIEDDPGKPKYIVTMHGIGYRFEGE